MKGENENADEKPDGTEVAREVSPVPADNAEADAEKAKAKGKGKSNRGNGKGASAKAKALKLTDARAKAKAEAKAKCEGLKAWMEQLGYNVTKVQRELSVYDDHLKLDNGWI